MDYTAIDFLSDFGGYLGLFIGASILYLYDISTHFILQIITKLKSRIEELKTEYDGYDEGQDESTKMNEKIFEITKNTKTTPKEISYSETEKIKLLINLQKELAKQGHMLAKHDNMITTLKNNMDMK